jgi:SIR2-like domain
MDAAQAFRDLITANSCQGVGHNALMNVTFFVGAGFSKTWDEQSPTGYELFTFPQEFLAGMASAIEIDELLTQPGYPTLDDAAPATFKELVYNLSMQLKYPGIRTRYMDERSIRFVLNEIKALVQKRFEALTALNYYAEAQGKFLPPAVPTNNQATILRFFQWLSEQQEKTRGAARGVHADFLSTNYDYVLETILDNVGDQNVLRNTYRGITPTSMCGQRNTNIVQDHWSINTLIKINGGFELMTDGVSYDLDYRRRTFDDIREIAPEIMMPSKEQNYASPYFSAIFPKAVRLLQESRVLVIVGYSLSEEDALLRFLIRQFAEDLRDVHGKYIFYVDYTSQDTLTERLQGCFRYMNRMDAGNIFTYSGGFVDWITNVMEPDTSARR